MAAGATTLDLLDEAAYDYMESLGALLEEEMGAVLEKHGNPMRMVRRESLFWLSPGDGEPAIGRTKSPKTLLASTPTSIERCWTEATCWRPRPTRLASFPPLTTKGTSEVSWRRWTMRSRIWS